MHNNTVIGATHYSNKRGKALVSTSLKLDSSQQAPTQPSYNTMMRFSHQGFGNNVSNLNSSLMLPGTSQALDLNSTGLHAGSTGQIANMLSSGVVQTKNWLNSSFDASKSAN
jgi:hypothetical protein